METLTIPIPPKKPAVYYLITAYLYIASISLFKYLITCLPIKASGYTSFPQLASYTNLPLPLHKTLFYFQNAEMTHYCSACSEASMNDCSHNQRRGASQLRGTDLVILQCQQNRGALLWRQCTAGLRDTPAHLTSPWSRAGVMHRGAVLVCCHYANSAYRRILILSNM